ncbi:acyl-CoA carboxylase subunit epsilon [Nocardioides mangrovicus]|uniref:Acyl-CoA carboxylase subunit epsilon n=1 Tax=Nocardioides mangrovicus TaxID=2478913 RepID=A0A3L8P5K3_9ACTN|nr:acyl-CoA carboxylase subunit epsilon [Nocardioides mangrovicus]RLV49929.1 acyl-CoA carboxylase subunit epsilon [Nocardioides mangrovicus]
MSDISDEAAPLFLVDGDATPEQVAALVAVFSSLGGRESPAPPTSEWAAPARRLRTTYAAGPGAWRGSGLPGSS